MTELFAQVRSHCRCCHATRCAQGRCRAALPQGERVCLNGDDYRINHGVRGKLADCIIFAKSSGGHTVHVVELKGGGLDVKDAVEQLQGGATLVESLLNANHTVTFHPVLLSNTLKSIARKALDRERVRFRGRHYPVWQRRCGSALPTD